MSAVQVNIGTSNHLDPTFAWYEVFASETNLALGAVEASAEWSTIDLSTRIIHANVSAGETWYFWVRPVYDQGARAGTLVALGSITISGGASDGADNTTDLIIEALGTLEDGERIAFIRFRRAYTLETNFGDAVGRGDPAATGSSVFTFKKNGSTFGTATFAAAGTSPTFATTADGSPADGDYWEVFAPATADATLQDVTFSIPLERV